MNEQPIEEVQRRWQRRYAGRRFVYGVPVAAEPMGTLVDKQVALGIAMGRVKHDLVRAIIPVMRPIDRWLVRQPFIVVLDRLPTPPRWLTFWNMMYFAFALYVLLVLFMVWRGA